MDDCISRQSVLEILDYAWDECGWDCEYGWVKEKVINLPSAQQITFDGVTLYRCDPEKNASCKKTNCYVNDGPCCMTSKKEYSEMDAVHRMDATARTVQGGTKWT